MQHINRLAYFNFFFLGVTFSLAGVVPLEIAGKYQVDTYMVGYVFALFTLGNSLAILGNGCLLDRVNLQKDMIAGLVLICAGIGGTTLLSPNLVIFSCFILTYGLGLGILCSIGNYTMVSLYRDEQRTAKLNLLNFFYSCGAVFSPALAGFLLYFQVTWEALYQLTLVLVAAICYGLVSAPFSLISRQQPVLSGECSQPWGVKIYLIGFGLLCYVLSEMIFTYWIYCVSD
ncbi:MFS transporter [Acetonema longum]|uniref:Major facilitator superfamily MFS_1 n=1 Tax=Acetonema longum DSM 6540 TaxID=1009370 RepID=F7NDJ3_9FIRM|nr:MFS transporter [Acetonema longum]EGO65855.1 major facilitator superfamily MFS_1 [Acetonema longum DSM 6540]